MSVVTAFLQLIKPGGGSTGLITPPERVDIDVLNDNAQKIDDWAAKIGNNLNRAFRYYGPSASIGAVSPAPKDGDEYQESDGNKILWKRIGGVWVTNEGGLYLIRPATFVNATINAAGEIIPNAAVTSISVNGAFSSRFREYIVKFHIASTASATLTCRLRNAGADVTGSVYGNEAMNLVGATAPATASGTLTSITMSATTTNENAGQLGLTNVQKAGAIKGGEYVCGGFSNWRTGRWQGNGLDANTYDGFTLTLSAGNFEVDPKTHIKVYGVA